MNSNHKLILIFVITYVVLYVLSVLGVFAKWTSPLYYLGTLAFFFISYYLFEFLQKEFNFNFAESYIGLIYLILLYLGFWAAFRIYYGNVASLNNISYSEFYTKQGLNLFKYLISTPYIYLALSAFVGWLTFYFNNFKSKK